MNCSKYERKFESKYSKSKYIAEFYNTLSNLPFIIYGVSYLLFCSPSDKNLWYLMIGFGVCSSIHHAIHFKGSILVDYIPIVSAWIYIYNFYLSYIDFNDLIHCSLPLFILITDHIYTFIPVPWGHVLWHTLASSATYSLFVKFDTQNSLDTLNLPSNTK